MSESVSPTRPRRVIVGIVKGTEVALFREVLRVDTLGGLPLVFDVLREGEGEDLGVMYLLSSSFSASLASSFSASAFF
jgi:hypothetical protein